ncbi:rho guanine nucleotide exchange factor 38 [Protopterus annectens]|uniref:rho guanine nucleotide exchange factor 38 n=1 Tax=Protopterus annectens TaxID=7888 RepID=UPI001CFA00E5|nr:rho guanine nucleotide exchange factor 38 [Protopterus annectens]
MENKETSYREIGGGGGLKRNMAFLKVKPKHYLSERRKTDTIIEDASTDSNNSATVKRSQSDRTEYSHKLKEKMSPNTSSSAPVTPTLDPEEKKQRMMAKRAKVIMELVQTEKDFLCDVELCIQEVVQPLRNLQNEKIDVDGLFRNIESVRQISAKLLSLLEDATYDVEPELQILGEVFLQIKAPLEEVYKVYCRHHDDAISLLESYEKDDNIKVHLRTCMQQLKKIYEDRGKPNLLDMGSLMIKPIQRVMKYPLLLCELLNATPPDHPDRKTVEDAYTEIKEANTNINEFKRRKDLVMKYIKNDDEESVRDKLSRLNIHSIRKKSQRVTGHLKMLTGGEQQVKDKTFSKEEKLFRNLEKAVRLFVKNVAAYCESTEEAMSVAVQNVLELQSVQETNPVNNGNSQTQNAAVNPYDSFKGYLQRMVLTPLTKLQPMFSGPLKLIQKRYDKLLDYNSFRQKSTKEEQELARKDYEALNAQLVEELQAFNRAARVIFVNCLCCFMTLLRSLMSSALQSSGSLLPGPFSSSSITEVQNRVLEDLENLNFVKENSSGTHKLVERKLSLEKKRSTPTPPEFSRQTENNRSKLLSAYCPDKLYQAKRNFNATQELDVNLCEGDLVAVVAQQDPLGSTSRWLVDNGVVQGYVYSSFLKPYNPVKVQNGMLDNSLCGEDYDNISLFVPTRDISNGSIRSDSSSSVSELCDKSDVESSESEHSKDINDQQYYYAVYAFQARTHQELTLQEYQKVRILHFSDLSGNKEWWLAETNGQKGYVPANYLAKMTYA